MERKTLFSLSGLLTILSAGILHAGFASLGAAESPVELRTSIDRPIIDLEGCDRRVVIKIEVEGARRDVRARMPLNLAIVLDRSGSMSGAKLEQAKQAACYLVDQLDTSDVLSLVLYDTEVQVPFPATRIGNRHAEVKRLIRRIETGGSTALYGGVDAGGKQLAEYLSEEKINRVMLLSDGIANVGPSSNREIADLGNRLAREGMSVTTIGLGNDYNETLMTALAEASDANYYYVADVEDLPRVFAEELGELKSIVARDIEIRIRCPKGVRPIRFLGRPGDLKNQEESLVFATLSSEQSREIYLECEIEKGALGEITEIAEVETRFQDSVENRDQSLPRRPIVVGYTRDEKIASAVVDQAIVAEAAISRNAEELEAAVALADEGSVEESRMRLETQKANLEAVYAGAPAAQQEVIKEEIATLGAAARELEEGSLSRGQRKVLTNRAWEVRNAKQK